MKTEGLFSKVTRERVSSNPGRRSGDGRLESAWGRKAGRNSDTGGKLHGRRRGGHRRARLGAHEPRFEEPKAQGSSGGSREPVQAKNRAGGRG